MSTNSFGSDLDTRPVGMARKEMIKTVKQCKHCGYCATDLETGKDSAKAIVQSEGYQQILTGQSLPKLARRWVCDSLIDEHSGDLPGAGWSRINAAWACEDHASVEGATAQRQHALRIFKTCLANNQEIAEDISSAQLVLCDLHRRIGEFARSSEIANTLVDDDDKTVKQVARFQIHLCKLEDDRRYQIDDAEHFARKGDNWKPRRWWEFWR